MQLNSSMVSILAFAGVFGVIAAVFLLIKEWTQTSLEDRLDVLAGKKKPGTEGDLSREAMLQEGMSGLAGMFHNLVSRFTDLKLLFVQADSPMKAEQFFLICCLSGAVGVVFGFLLKLPIPLFPVLGVCFGGLPLMWLMWRRNRRFKKFAKQLPDALELIGRALRSGHSLASGMHVVVDEMPDPISKEFGIAYEEQNLGIPLEQSLRNVYKRVPNLDYKFFSTAVAIQRQSGGDLAEILDKIGQIVRDRFRIQGQVQALTGEGRISGSVLMALPILLFFAVWKLNPEYVMLLFEDPIGKQMVGGAVILQILGAICIKKIIAIKV